MITRLQCLTASPASARRLFILVLVVLTALRAAFSAVLPLTGDEAYFMFWGLNPDWGFYDHPPMVGWWLAPLSALSLEPFVLRLPALVAPPIVAFVAVSILRRHGEALAWSGGALLLLVPLNAWNVAITTDIPLMIFSALTVRYYLRAQHTGRRLDFLLAGLMLAGALMSKYFAGLLAIAIFLHSVWQPGMRRPDRRRLGGLLWVVLGSLPAAAIQIAWNSQNCWPNIMFNLVNRNKDAGLSWQTSLLFVISVVYVLTPEVAWRLLRGGRQGGTLASEAGPAAPAAADATIVRWLALVPLAIFALLSLAKTIGLHWMAAFVLPAALYFMLVSGPRARARGLAVAGVIALAHWLVIGVLVALPTDTFRSWKDYPSLVMTVHADELARALQPWRGRFVIASSGYSPAVTLGHALHEYVFVFGPGSSHARHDDILTDMRALAGRDILVVRKDDHYEPADYQPYFDHVEYKQLSVRGVTFYLIEGHGFRYEPYRDTILEEIRRRWYAVPAWLPSGPCYFCDRYFPDRSCHR